MALTGKQKAAMLLMSLDAATAAELVKGLDTEVVHELQDELAHLDVAGLKNSGRNARIVEQFHHSLQAEETFKLSGFLNEVLKSTVGAEKAGQIQEQIQDVLYNRDPFVTVRSVDSQTLASILEYEHPQTAAVILSELSADKKREVLGFLDVGVRFSTVRRMCGCDKVTAEEKKRMAETVCRRLEVFVPGLADEVLAVRPEQSLRKVAVILRNLGREIRDGLLSAIHGKSRKVSKIVADLMVVWADIPQTADRSLRKALKGVDAKQLALALNGADESIAEKIRSNISRRTVAAVDEQALRMQVPGQADIEAARENIVRVLRDMNDKSELVFVENECDV